LKEIKQDLFIAAGEPAVDAICITTNGQYTRQGIAAMGGGCAGICARHWPETAQRLGRLLKTFGKNIPFVIGALDANLDHIPPNQEMIKNKKYKCLIFSFPTMGHLGEPASLDLIKQSTLLIKDFADNFKLMGVVIPRPGCGIGGLDYYQDVRPVLNSILDDRFTIVCQEGDYLI